MRGKLAVTSSRGLGWFALVGALGLFMAGPAGAARLGPGSGISSAGVDTGDRLNVATRAVDIASVAAGTYDIQSFSYTSTTAGNVTPFLAVRTNGTDGSHTYSTLWVGPTVTGTA